MRFKGTLVDWNDARGFGFIQPAEGGERVFCHISAFRDRTARPSIRQVVTYELGRDERGRAQARQIRCRSGTGREDERAGPRRAAAATPLRSHTGPAVACAGAFLLSVAGLVIAGRLPWFVLAWYAGASAVTFLVYAWDKTAAEGGHWRTPESTLNGLALAGGWPGAWIAQQALRHKSRKTSFQVAFWSAVAANLAALAWLVFEGGALLP